ncbi:MAG: hypothetical protein WD768_06940 [Phycisphaeraceae bacterium]
MRFTITASSSALFSTWIFIEELGLLFDAGDGLCAALATKARKIRHAFITHADRDHMAGLLQFNQLNARDGQPVIHYPKDCGSFPALRDFVRQFDPQSGPATWNALDEGDEIAIDDSHSVLALRSEHVELPGSPVKALRYIVRHKKRVLRPEHIGLKGSAIARLRKEQGEDAVTQERIESLLGYSGDAPRLDPASWMGVKLLLHECTFLQPDTARRPHANLPEVLAAAAALELEALILLHFSTRYDASEITQAIAREARTHGLRFPVYAILPGATTPDVLAGEPVWKGSGED